MHCETIIFISGYGHLADQIEWLKFNYMDFYKNKYIAS